MYTRYVIGTIDVRNAPVRNTLTHGSRADRADAERLATLISNDDAPEILARAEAMAIELVTRHREAIFQVARRVFEHGSLSGGEVRSVCLQGL